jgi:hypothetical protein
MASLSFWRHMNKLTIVFSGKKQSGKTSSCNHIRARYMNRKLGLSPKGRAFYHVDELGDLFFYRDGQSFKQSEMLLMPQTAEGSVKLYSFADPLKTFLINVFGVPHECCYGTDLQKNTPMPHLLWDNLPDELRPKAYHGSDGTSGESHVNPPDVKSGPMTARDIMQIFGTEICRRLYGDCWARGTYSAIRDEGHELALVSDGRFPNEITMGTIVNAKSIRLMRHVFEDNHASERALDDFALTNYSVALDNRDKTFEEQLQQLDPIIDKLFDEAGI